MRSIVSEITNGVKVSVEAEFLPRYSSPVQMHFAFSYRIKIENHCDFTIRLLNRKWFIFDSGYPVKEVSGEGVVGEQPILEPKQSFEYISGSNLKSGLGKMTGHYEFERMVDEKRFLVKIPDFNLIVPYKNN